MAATPPKTYPTEVLKKLPLFYFTQSSLADHVIVYDKKALLDEFYTIFKFKKIIVSAPSSPKYEVAVFNFGEYVLHKHSQLATGMLSELLAYFFHEHIHTEVLFHTWHVEDLPSSLSQLTKDILEATFIDPRLRIPASEIQPPCAKFSQFRPLISTELCDQCPWYYSILFYKRTVALAIKLRRNQISFVDIQSKWTTQNVPLFFLSKFPYAFIGNTHFNTTCIKEKIHHLILQAMILCDNLTEQIESMSIKISRHLRVIYSPKTPIFSLDNHVRYDETERDVCQVISRFFALDDNSKVQWVVTFSALYNICSTYPKKAMCIFDTTTLITKPKSIYILVQPENKLLFLS